MKKRGEMLILIAAGGSGGHVYPAMALAEELIHQKISVHFATDQRGMAYISPSMAQHSVHVLKGIQTSPHRWLRRLHKLFYGLRAGIQSVCLLHQLRPSVVIGFGGFATLPVLLAAVVMGYPYMLHEQNAILGKVNRLFARRARSIAVSYQNTQRMPKKSKDKIIETGMPTRPALGSVSLEHPYRLPADNGKLTLFVFGGSQGAQSFDEMLPKTIALMPADKRARLHIIQQCRNDVCKAVETHYQQLGVTAEIAPFFNTMALCYAAAHVILCRAGASTIAELKVTGRPAILVPYPWAVDDHQKANADEIEKQTAGWVLSHEYFTPQRLLSLLLSFLEHPGTLLYAAESMHCLARKKAHVFLADAIKTVA